MTPEELVAEAKRRYPVGTRFVPAHMSPSKCSSVITADSTMKVDANMVISLSGDGKSFLPDSVRTPSRYGDNCYERLVYYNGIWAEIVGSPVPEVRNEYQIY